MQAELKQIEEKRYEQALVDRGILKEHIRKYGFAFEGKKVLTGESQFLRIVKTGNIKYNIPIL